MITHAMVMAAGLGTRMRPLTDHIPKPLVQVAGKALIDHTLDWLLAGGVRHAVVNSHYKAELLEAHLATRQAPRITISREEVLLETGGGLKKALPLLGDAPFVSTNSDVICINGARHALERLQARWDDTLDALLLVHPVDRAVGYEGRGDFFVEGDGALRRRKLEEAAPFVFTGIQLLHPRLFHDAPEGAFSLNVLYNRALQSPVPRMAALVHDGDWLHVGDPKGRDEAQDWLLKQ